jgi:hypothetical protein
MKVGVRIRSFPLTLTLSRQGRGEAIHSHSRAGKGILAYFYKGDDPRSNQEDQGVADGLE